MLRILAFISVCLFATLVRAQHDPHRNATQAIALKQFEKAAKELAKADPQDPETQFVQMMLELQQGDLDQAARTCIDALESGLPISRIAAGPKELLDQLHQNPEIARRIEDDCPIVIHGPMLGRVSDSSVSFWLRTRKPASVQILVGDTASAIQTTSAENDYVAILKVDGLNPQQRYAYQLKVNGDLIDLPDRHLTTFPKQGTGGKFSVAFGGGAGFVPKWEYMWNTIEDQSPHALLMLGDNVYIDQPKQTLCQDYCYYRRQSRPEWQQLTGATSVYAIYDDHDFGTNDCIPGPEIERPTWKRLVWQRFKRNWINPAFGGGEEHPGCWFDFHIGDVHFIMLDGRYYRDLKGGSMLGAQQKKWLFETLKASQGTFKILASPVPWTAGIKPGSKDPWDGYPEEREEIFSFLETNKIDGVFLVAADRHRTDLRTTQRPNGYDLYEFESSRLTNRHTHGVIKTPGLIWGYNEKCSFGLMHFDTQAEEPTVKFECRDIDGNLMHDFTLQALQLTHR